MPYSVAQHKHRRAKLDSEGDVRTPRGADCPARRCALTRLSRPRDELIRFVAAPDGAIVADLSCKLPGRGVWITCGKTYVEDAVRRNVFERSLRKKVNVPASLPDDVDRALVSRVKGALSVANKAGLVSCGFTKVEQAISRGNVIAVVHAIDAAKDGAEKLDRLYAHVAAECGVEAHSLKVLGIEEMSLALGRLNVVHAAVRAGGAGAAFMATAAKLACYRAGPNGIAGQSNGVESAATDV